MALVILSLTLLLLAVTSAMNIPSGYILDVTPVCGTSASSRPVINILTDLNVRAVGRCANGDQNFTRLDAANFRLSGSYNHRVSGCLFVNHKGVLKLDIAVMYGIPGTGLLSNEQIYTVSCAFNSKGKAVAKSYRVNAGLVSPLEKLYEAGSAVSSSYIQLSIQDIRGKAVTGGAPIDKVITLYATSRGTFRESGLRPVSCYAIGAKNKKMYAILRSGCGDGIVIPKNQGFLTRGRSSRSPYFSPFYVEGDRLIKYYCKFQLCSGNCNGSSCQVGSNLG